MTKLKFEDLDAALKYDFEKNLCWKTSNELPCFNIYLTPIIFERIKKMIKEKPEIYKKVEKDKRVPLLFSGIVDGVEQYDDYSSYEEDVGEEGQATSFLLDICYKDGEKWMATADVYSTDKHRQYYCELDAVSPAEFLDNEIISEKESKAFIDKIYDKYDIAIPKEVEEEEAYSIFEGAMMSWADEKKWEGWELAYEDWLKDSLQKAKELYPYLVKKDTDLYLNHTWGDG